MADRSSSRGVGTRAANAREAELLTALSGRYRTPLLRFFAKRLPADADAEDLVQDVFVRLIRRERVSDIEKLDGYVFQIADNLRRDLLRQRLARPIEPLETLDETALPADALTPDRALEGKQRLDLFLAALKELPERTATIFMLHRWDQMSHADIAARVGISVSAVEKHMVRAIAHLARRMRGER